MKYDNLFKSLGALSLVLLLGACQDTSSEESGTPAEEELTTMSFEELAEQAAGTEVYFYGWGGDEQLNNWLDEVYEPHMLEKHNITVDYIGMDIEEILNKLSNEKQAGQDEGTIDMIWINGENFQSAMENDFLYGPFVEMMPNYQNYIDSEDPEHNYDFGYPIEGHEAPYGKAQMVFVKDSERTPETPRNAEELLEFARQYPGTVTYPALPDFAGSAFVRNIIYEFVDYNEFVDMPAEKERVEEAIEPALGYLRELNPYLWREGQTFPSSSTELNNMFMDGEATLYQTYSPYEVAVQIEQGSYPETAESFIFENGTIGNTNFIAIAENAPNKAGAIVAIDEMLSPEMQLSRYEELREIPVLDNESLSDEQQEAFDSVDPGPGTIPQDELLDHRKPEMPAELVPIIEEIWQEEVVGQYNHD